MKRDFLTKGLIIAFTTLSFSACGGSSGDDYVDNYEVDNSSPSGVDTLKMERGTDALYLTWTKNSSDYSELAYSDKSDDRGTYIITSNTKGTYTANCQELNYSDEKITFECDVSNLYGSSRYMTFYTGKEYKFYTNYGTDLTRGEVEKTLTYLGNGNYTIE